MSVVDISLHPKHGESNEAKVIVADDAAWISFKVGGASTTIFAGKADAENLLKMADLFNGMFKKQPEPVEEPDRNFEDDMPF